MKKVSTQCSKTINGKFNLLNRNAIASILMIALSHVFLAQNLTMDVLVVGGGGGAGWARGGGGGGGGYIYQSAYNYSGGSTAITVGTGGIAGSAGGGTGVHATSGSNSSFGSTFVAIGGGGGGSYGGGPQNGYSGGSGGGGANQSSSANTGFGGAGTAGQGFAGGNSRCGGGGEVSGGGGGGAGGPGTNGTSSGCGGCGNRPYNPGNGGNGLQNSISGTAVWYAGGGGGGGLGGNCSSGPNLQGNNGLGGGQASYGGGGQCKVVSGNFQCENGGPGIVIIRYIGTPVATGGTITQVGGYTIHTFTSSGTFTYNPYVVFTTQPSAINQNYCLNAPSSALTVSATATSGNTPTYQWYSNTTASTTGGTLISGATTSSFIPPTNIAGIKYYYCIASNNLGSATSAISGSVTVAALSVSGTASSNQTICSGSSPAAISLSGNTGSIQWQSSTDNITFTPISGATGATLTSAQMGALTSVRYYRAIVTNGTCSSETSNTVTINVTVPPSITVTSGSNCGTGSVNLSASAASGTLNWYAASSGGVVLATGSTYNTPSISVTTTYYVDVTLNGCTSSPRIAVSATVNPLPAVASNGVGQITAEVLLVGGGGAGGFRHAGGGGAGGVVYQNAFTISSGSYPVTIGSGGTGLGSHGSGNDGGNSTFSTLTAIGGGGGGSNGLLGRPGGSGGGGANGSLGGNGTASQGNKGGNQNNGNGCCFANGAGGGGAGAAGANTTGGVSSDGGIGLSYTISGTNVYYGGGGGGGTATTTSMAGGTGGGGAGGRSNALNGTAGAANTGGGGGGGGANGSSSGNGGNGGSGVLIIKYAGSPIATGGVITQVGGYTIHTFNSTGSFAFSGSSTANISDVSACNPSSFTINGVVSAGYTLDWYDAPTGGNLLSYGTSSFTTPILNASTIYYVSVRNISTGCVSATRTPVNASIYTSPTLSADQTICAGTQPSPISLTGSSGSIQWQVSTDNVSFSNISGATTSVLSSTQMGILNSTRYYKALITGGACGSITSSTVTVSVISPSTISTTPGTNCGPGVIALSANVSGGGIINWYSGITGGPSLSTGSNFITPLLSTTTTYYVENTENGCTSSPRIAVTATINTIPQNATNVPTSIEYLVVGGGGGGGFDGAGGGGGGQVKTGSMTLNAGSYAVTIGAGGANATSVGSQASDGGTTTFNTPTPISSIGGGGGGSKQANGKPGANGGGAGHHANTIRTGGTSSVGGFSGGNNGPTTATAGFGGGGGGGAAGAGTAGPAGNGGAGVASSITGTLSYYGGGGGGGSYNGQGTGVGGIGGGGTGGRGNSPLATAGAPNTGGGGGGAGEAVSNPGKAGGSGVVIVRYAGTPIATGGIITQNGGYTIHTFNSNGTFAYNGAQSGAIVPNASNCGPGSVTLSGTAAAGMTLDWYDAATGGTLLSSGTLNYTTPVLTSTTVYYVSVRNTSTGCTSAARSAVTVTINGSAGISANQTICSGQLPNAIVLNNPSGSIQWQSSNDNVSFTNISGQTSSTLSAVTIGNLNATKYFRALITNGACSATTPVHTITVNPVNINGTISTNDLVWRGTLDNNWEVAGNWSLFDGTNYSTSNATPTNINNVVIPANQNCVLNQPVMGSSNSSVKNITIDSGAILTASNGILSVNGNFINHGSFIQGTGTVKMVGSNPTDSIVCDGLTNTFYNLTIEKINGNHVQLNAAIAITNQLSLINKDLFLNGNVIDLGNSGQLINEGSGHRVYCDSASGYIQRTAAIGATQTINPGNLGLTFNTTGNQLGTTVIRRRHSRAGSFGLGSISGTTPGIYRIFEVIPQFNGADYTAGADPGLNLNLEFTYLNEEIGSEISSLETDFGIFRSINSGNTWNAHFGTVNTTSNVVSISNFDAFSWITVGPNTVTALPVELTSFQANCKEDGTTAITWVTASEHNSSHFELEKSRDGLSWASEGIIAAAGNSINTINYELTDSDRNTTMVYYLLHQYDNDGEKTTYGPVSIDCDFEAGINFYTFPNPGTSDFSLYFNAGEASGKAKLIVYDSDGRKMIENETEIAKGNNVIQMNNEPLKPGVYFIQLQIDEGLSYWTKHVIK